MLTKAVTTLRQLQNSRYHSYLFTVSALGILLVFWSVFQVAGYDDKLNFFLLMTLAMVAQISSTSMSITKNTEIILAVGNAVTIAVIPFYGPAGAVAVSAFSTLSIWLATSYRKAGWKKSWQQLVVNAGMQSIAVFCAGYAFIFVEQLVEPIIVLKVVLPWLVAAIVDDQVNLVILIGILLLQKEEEISAKAIWQANLWSMPISIAITSIGGGMLAYAVTQFGWIGVLIFFLPIILSAYAFRLYVNQMQAHMDNLENIIAERTDTLKELMREKDSFLAVLTHDMKSPLTTIGIYAGLLRDNPGLLLERPYITDRLSNSQETLVTIVDNILDLEKMQAGGTLSMEKIEFDLVLLVEAVTEILKAQANEKNIALEYWTQFESLSIVADRNQIERALQNLLSNAIKYTPKDKNILVKVRADDKMAFIDVIDSGYGIPADELPFVFERFRRVAKHKKNAPGTGLGLAITKGLIEAHGGEISVISEEDKGSQFTISLPR